LWCGWRRIDALRGARYLPGECLYFRKPPPLEESTVTEAFVYDAVRTPRGKGKEDGSLHEVKPVNLLAGVLTELQRRNDFDTGQVDDVVMGVVSPIGEQGSVIAKVAALKAG
jgi:hypothetical protein